LPPAGSSLSLPGCPSQHSGYPTWFQPLPAFQDPFSPDLMSYWHALNCDGLGSCGSTNSEGLPTPLSSVSDWSSLYNLSRIPALNSVPGRQAPSGLTSRTPCVQKPTFDGRDRLCLEEGWVLIKGESALFLEAVCKGLDPSLEVLSNAHKCRPR